MGMMTFRPGQRLVIPSVQVFQPLVASAGGSSALYTNLVSYWSMDEASGTRNDSKGTNHLTETGTVGNVAGKISNAISPVSGANHLSRASNSTLQSGNIDFAFSMWVYIPNNTGSPYLLDKGNEFQIQRDGATLYFFIASFGKFASRSGYTLNAWHHIMAWHDAAADTMNLQIDNGTVGSTATTGVAPTADSSALYIGTYHGNSAYTWNGYIDEVAYWKNYAPNSTERAWLYNSGNGRSFTDIYNYA